MAENIIYNELVETDYENVLAHINEMTRGMKVGPCSINESELRYSVLQSMRLEFPYKNGLDKANVFKKAGYFMAHFIAIMPVQTVFPASVVGRDVAEMSNHQNAIIALQIAIESLHGASVIRSDGSEVAISNRIELSKHSLVDIIDAIRSASINGHSKVFAVMLEQMAYKCNHDAQGEYVIF